MSDHFLISFSVSFNHREPKVYQAESPFFFNYKMADFRAIDFNPTSANNIDSAWEDLKTTIINARNKFVPTFVPSRGRNPRWFTPEIRRNIKRIRSLRRRIDKKPTPTKLQKLADLQSSIHHLMESAKVEYESSLVATFGSSPRKVYSFLRDLGKTNSMLNFFHHNNSVIDNPPQIAELFNNYFNSTFTSSEFLLPDIDQLPLPSTHLSNIFINESDVYEVFTTLNPTKSAGSDEISAKLLKPVQHHSRNL